MAMDYLSRSLQTLTGVERYKFHPRCSKLNVTQLCFADDLLLFCDGHVQSVRAMQAKFKQFSLASGLYANKSKSAVYMGKVKQCVQEAILQKLGFIKGELPFRYLGVPLSFKRLFVSQCQPLIDRMLNCIKS